MKGLIVAATLAWLFFPQPPAEMQGDAIVPVYFVSSTKIDDTCRALGAAAAENAAIFACANPHIVVLPNPCGLYLYDAYAELACHELGHVHGWKHEDY